MIQDITTNEFITGVINGQLNENDVYHYCEKQPYLMALFKSLLKAASGLIHSKGVDGFGWNLTERRFDFDNSKDLRLYCDVEFVRLQNAMGIVCDLIEKRPTDERPPLTAQQLPDKLNTDEARRYFDKAIELGLMSDDYKWLKGLQMLACFARDFSLKLNMGKGDRISWKPFEALFGIPQGKLRGNYNDIQKTGQNPSESDLIDKVFE